MDNVAELAPEARDGDPALKKVRALRGGVDAMRSAGQTYLPKEELESTSDYQARLARSWLFPALDKATKDQADKVFAKPVVLGRTCRRKLRALKIKFRATDRTSTISPAVCLKTALMRAFHTSSLMRRALMKR